METAWKEGGRDDKEKEELIKWNCCLLFFILGNYEVLPSRASFCRLFSKRVHIGTKMKHPLRTWRGATSKATIIQEPVFQPSAVLPLPVPKLAGWKHLPRDCFHFFLLRMGACVVQHLRSWVFLPAQVCEYRPDSTGCRRAASPGTCRSGWWSRLAGWRWCGQGTARS